VIFLLHSEYAYHFLLHTDDISGCSLLLNSIYCFAGCILSTVCLSAFLSVSIKKLLVKSDLHENFTRDVSVDTLELIKF